MDALGKPVTNASSDPKSWVDLHGDYLFRFALSRVRDRQVAEDVVQETFIAALKARERFGGRSEERTWFVAILKNKIIDHFRRVARDVDPESLANSADQAVDYRPHGERAGAWLPGRRPTYSELGSSNDFAIGLRWTIGPGGLLDLGRSRSTAAQVAIAEIRLESASDSVREEVRLAFGGVRIQTRMLSIALHGLDDAAQALSLSQDRQEHGIGLPLEVIDAAEAMRRAELAYARTMTNYNKAQIALLVASGDLSDLNPDR